MKYSALLVSELFCAYFCFTCVAFSNLQYSRLLIFNSFSTVSQVKMMENNIDNASDKSMIWVADMGSTSRNLRELLQKLAAKLGYRCSTKNEEFNNDFPIVQIFDVSSDAQRGIIDNILPNVSNYKD